MTTMRASRDRIGPLWELIASPGIWAIHLLLSYITAAIQCAKAASPTAAIADARLLIAIYTVVALVAITMLGWRGWRQHADGRSTPPHGADSPESRAQFLGFATFLLSGLSAVAVAFLAASVALSGTCR